MNTKLIKNAKKLECISSELYAFTAGNKYEITDILYEGFFVKGDDGDDYYVNKLYSEYLILTPIYEETNLDRIKESGFYVTQHNKTTPPHYQGTIQPIDLINAQNLNFNLGNVVKYVCRAGKKDGETTIKDLNKAIDYLNFEIERLSHE